jgi:hypothetical protein
MRTLMALLLAPGLAVAAPSRDAEDFSRRVAA